MVDYKIDEDIISDFGDVVPFELATALKINIDYMSAFCPVGAIAPILYGMPGVPLPDPNMWQECDGSEIINPNSPLRSQGGSPRFTPNMLDRYIRMPINFGVAGNSGGTNVTLTFRHNHGGRTNVAGVGGAIKGGYDKRHARSHDHGINTSFNDPMNVEPPHYVVRFYMRIQ